MDFDPYLFFLNYNYNTYHRQRKLVTASVRIFFRLQGENGEVSFATLRVKSFIGGYHVYKEHWEPELNEERELTREPESNPTTKMQVDPNTVTVVRPLARPVKDCDLNQASCSSQSETNPKAFIIQTNEEVIKRRTNKGKVVVTGKRVNRGAGYGLEIPREYIFYGDNKTSIP